MFVYIREAHPIEESPRRKEAVGGGGPGAIALPKDDAERHAAARRCVDGLELTLPTVVDTFDDAVNKAYGAWPDRLYVVGVGGQIAFAGGPGPWGFEPDEVDKVLDGLRVP